MRVKTFEERTLYGLLVRLKKTGTKDLPASLAKLPAFLQRLIDDGVYVAAGEFGTHDGGLVLLRLAGRDEAERYARLHPFSGKKFGEVSVFEWSARWALWNLMGAGRKPRVRRLKKLAAALEPARSR